MRIPLIKPFISDEVKERVLAVLDSGYLTEGAVTREFEEICRQYLGSRYCIAVSSCTVGLEIALRCLNIGPGDEVIVPDFTYPATADAAAIVGAKIVLVDIDPKTMLIDYSALERAIGPRTKAVLPVSLFGNALDYDRLTAIKDKHGIFIIEDAAGSLGAEYKGNKVGTLADITVFSFHPRKFITTGEGGLIATDNDLWSSWMKSYKKFGIMSNPEGDDLIFETIGTNYKMSDVLGAIGLGQMQVIGELLKKRKKIASSYIRMLDGVSAVSLPRITAGASHSYQSFCIFVENRDRILYNLRSQGIEVQIGTYSLHLQPAFRPSQVCKIKGNLNGSSYAFEHCLTLPLYYDMAKRDQEEVITLILSYLED